MKQVIFPLNREHRFTDVAPLIQVSHVVAERYLTDGFHLYQGTISGRRRRLP